MDSSQGISLKKQRNAKMRNDRRHKTYKKADSDKAAGSVIHSDSGPQYQRPESLQENKSSLNDDSERATKFRSQVEGKESTNVDFGNLKRETEEIAKLTKKFSKREITSNWHRYAAAETDPRAVQEVECQGPANFAELLQIPASRGGHLQLKEEQEWTSATHGNHWALNLQQLSSSMACIPTHERLRLPQDKLTREEIQFFIFQAEEGKKCYNTEKECDLVEGVAYNILDVEKSTSALLNMTLETDKISANNVVTLENTNLKVNSEIKCVDIKSLEESVPKINNLLNNKSFLSNNNDVKSSNVDKLENIKPNLPTSDPALYGKVEILKPVIKMQCQDKNHLIENKTNQTSIKVEVPQLAQESRDEAIAECKAGPINNYDIKEQRPERRRRKSPMKEELVNKTLEKINDVKLEDDVDLDFLLSLKKPVLNQKEIKVKPATLTDSSFFPGQTASSTTQAQDSDLDAWLDSVLQD